MAKQAGSYSKGTAILAEGILWTITSCGNGRYGVRAAGDSRVYTMRCAELHADRQMTSCDVCGVGPEDECNDDCRVTDAQQATTEGTT